MSPTAFLGCNGCEEEIHADGETEQVAIAQAHGLGWTLDIGVWWGPACMARTTHVDRVEILRRKHHATTTGDQEET